MKRFFQKPFLQKPAVREAAKAAAFLLILASLLLSLNRFFSFKFDDGLYNMELFYEQEENSIDVLILGSSHAYQHINTGILYDEFGLASFHATSGAQHLWTSYHHLKDALKTQRPALVVLEGYMLAATKDYRLEAWDVRNTFGLRPSLNRIRNIRASVPEDEFWEFFFRFYRYHTRYEGDLGPQDYYPNKGEKLYEDWKGYQPNYQRHPFDTPAALGATQVQPLLPDVERYFRQIIQLCQEENIPLYVVMSPCSISDEELHRCNRAQEIAAEYGVPFVNFNTPARLEQLDFDYANDLGAGNHLNYQASARFTRLLGGMLVSAYDLPDRRGDARYASWARDAAYLRRDFDNQQFLREQTQLAPYLKRLAQDPDYTVIFSVTGYLADYFDQITAWLAPFGIDDIYFTHDMNGTWASRGGEVLVRWSSDNRYPYVQLDDQTITLAQDHALAGRKPVRLTEKGLNIIVYDHVTQTIADTAGFDALQGFTAVRE